MKIKIIECSHELDLQDEINDFLEKNRIQQLFELIPNSKKWSLIFKKIIW